MEPERAARIKAIREQKGLTQQEVATLTGLSRPSYTNIERGVRDISLDEAIKLSDTLSFNLLSFESRDERGSYQKFRDLYLAFLQRAAATDGKITKTKLAKLIYLADFSWFAQHGAPITGVMYRHIQRGPVPDEFFRLTEELFDSGTISIETRGAAMLLSINEPIGTPHLTDAQLQLIDEIAQLWKDRDTASIVNFTHEQAPWAKTEQGEIIPYELASGIPKDKLY